MKSKKAFPLVLPLFLLSAPSRLLAQDCSNDTVPPVAICNDQVVVALNPGNDNPNDRYGPAGSGNNPPALGPKKWGGVTWVPASAFDGGSYDACNAVHLTIRRLAPYSDVINNLNAVRGTVPCDNAFPTFPSEFERAVSEYDSIKFYCGEAGASQVVAVRAYQVDANGNFMLDGSGAPIFNECLTTVTIEDKVKPAPVCPVNVTVSCESFDPSLTAYGVATATDNCCLDTIIKTLNYASFDTICSKGTVFRTFKALDCSGNSSLCTQRIVITPEQNYFVRFPDDLIITNGSTDYGQPVIFDEDCGLIGMSYSDEVFIIVPDVDIKIERTWTIINWCTYDPVLPVTDVPNPQPVDPPNDPANFPGPIVSAPGAPAPWEPTVVSITPMASPTDFSTFWSPTVNAYQYTQIIKIIPLAPAVVSGKVFVDTLDNCAYDSGEPELANWKVKIKGLITNLVYETLTDSTGAYSKSFDPTDTIVEVSLAASFNYGQNCPSVYSLDVASGQETIQDIPAHLESGCPLLSVDISAPFLRRCFSNTYTVQACNLSGETVQNAYTEVALDSYLDFTDSSIPGTSLGNNVYSFDLGNLEAGECRSFQIFFEVDCAAPLGYTHCTEAHVFPDTVCNAPSNWSGADLDVTGYCDGDSVRLTITNVGNGDMADSQDFVVVEDVVMYLSAPFQLDNGESATFAMPANGATWRMQAAEVANHPWGGVEAKAVEGCGGLNMTGLVTMFSFNTPDPFESVDCHENIGAYDPNDKQAFPKGYGAQHFLEANTDIEYHVRFQNTGTDTAFTVEVLDTLSQYLDAATVRPGAASHAYDFAALDGNVLRFRFDNILLPDSNVNEAASNGFVKFRVSQKTNNANGTRIENRAAIYFDFNDPVMTNTTFHTIGDHFVLVKTDENNPAYGSLQVYPNPAAGTVFFELPEATPNNRFTMTDNLGKTVVAADFSGKTFRFESGKLPAGVYFYQISSGNGGQFSGKVILKH